MNSNKNRLIFSIATLVLIIAVSLLVYQQEHKKLALSTQETTVKNVVKATPLTYTGSTLLNEFNKTTIENYPTAAGTYDLATMASEITSQMLQVFSATTTKILPLVANWNVGIPEYSDGLDPLYMINRLTNGEHIVPTWKLDPYYNDSIGLSYYETSIKKAAELGLPLVFTLPSPESALTKDDVYFTMDKTNNPNVITPKGIVLPKLSPFGPNSLWNEVGGQWSTTSLMAQLQEWYPNPPLVIFIDEDSAAKLSWSELSSSSRYQTQYPLDGTDEFKRTLVNAQWVEKYRQLHQGFVQGFTSDAWKKNAKFITRNQLAINMGTTNDWQNSATTTNLHANIWPLTANGLTIDFSLDGNKTLLNNLPFMLDEAKESNANFVSQLSIDASQQIADPNVYRGYTQLALWLLRPNIIRQTSNGTTKTDINPLFQQVVDSVELINNNDILADFWKNGKLVATGDSNHNLNIPTKYQTVPREFFLQTNATIPVYAFALEKGVAPNREWLIFTESPDNNLTSIPIVIPNFQTIQLDSSQEGNFYFLNEDHNLTDITTEVMKTNISSNVVTFSTLNTTNILDYGAIGDGITDNSQVFQKALSNEAILYIPDGTYLVKSRLFANKTSIIYGTGTIKGLDKTGILSTTSSHKLLIDGIHFEYTPVENTLFGAIYVNDSTIDQLIIQNCTFTGNSQLANAILLVGKQNHVLQNIKIIHNSFYNITRAAVEILERGDSPYDTSIVSGVKILDNNFTYNLAQQSTEFNPAISLSQAVNNTQIDNNYINGYYWGIELDGSINQTVTNNDINVTDRIMSIDHGSDPTGNTIIENNTFTSPYRFWIHTANKITLQNNTINSLVYIWESNGIKIQDNNISSNLFTTIWIKDSNNTQIIRNNIKNTKGYDAVRGVGTGSDSSNVVQNNTLYIDTNAIGIRNIDNADINFTKNTILFH